MDRVWDISKYDHKLSVSIFKVKVIQGHDVKKRSNLKCMFGTRVKTAPHWASLAGCGFAGREIFYSL